MQSSPHLYHLPQRQIPRRRDHGIHPLIPPLFPRGLVVRDGVILQISEGDAGERVHDPALDARQAVDESPQRHSGEDRARGKFGGRDAARFGEGRVENSIRVPVPVLVPVSVVGFDLGSFRIGLAAASAAAPFAVGGGGRQRPYQILQQRAPHDLLCTKFLPIGGLLRVRRRRRIVVGRRGRGGPLGEDHPARVGHARRQLPHPILDFRSIEGPERFGAVVETATAATVGAGEVGGCHQVERFRRSESESGSGVGRRPEDEDLNRPQLLPKLYFPPYYHFEKSYFRGEFLTPASVFIF